MDNGKRTQYLLAPAPYFSKGKCAQKERCNKVIVAGYKPKRFDGNAELTMPKMILGYPSQDVIGNVESSVALLV